MTDSARRGTSTASRIDPRGFLAEELTPEQVTQVLREVNLLGDGEVTAVVAEPAGEGLLAALHRLSLTYDKPGADGPTTMIAKCSSREQEVREFCKAATLYKREVLFYQELAPALPVATPAVYHAELTPDEEWFVLLLEDLAPARAVDQLTGCSIDDAALAMELMGNLQGATWDSDRLGSLTWLKQGLSLCTNAAAEVGPMQAAFREHYQGRLEEEYLAVGDRLVERIGDWVALLERQRCLWHGDFRLDNMVFDAKNGTYPIAMLDWQCVTFGPPVLDVSFFLGCGLSPEERQRHERELVGLYYSRLQAAGVEGYSWDDCWQDYRAHSVWGFLGALLALAKAQQSEYGDEFLLHLARSTAQQVIDSDAFDALAR